LPRGGYKVGESMRKGSDKKRVDKTEKIIVLIVIATLLVIVLSSLTIISASSSIAGHQPAEKTNKNGLIVHEPIYIGGNDNFTEENGVINGNGTEDNPYIIEGWDINASSAIGIEIRETDKYFIIRNCYIYGGKSGGYHGIQLYYVINGSIENVTSYHNKNGIILICASNNQIKDCMTYNNSQYGIYLRIDANNNVIANIFAYNNSDGIHLYYSDNNTIVNCTAYNNAYYGVQVNENCYSNYIGNCIIYSNLHGIKLYYSSFYNTVNNTKVYNNTDGIWADRNAASNEIMYCTIYSNLRCGLHLTNGAGHNTIYMCSIVENKEYGILITGTYGNSIYHNNFIQNKHQALVSVSFNDWDNGTHGNYWSDYNGTDANDDGIGDTPYNISGDMHQDNYPLINPIDIVENHAPVVNTITANPTTVSIGDTVTITVDASDEDTGDVLTYVYSCNGGTVSGTGNTVTWTAPDTGGTYTVSVYVNDGIENSNSKSVTVTVTDGGDTTDGGEEDGGEEKAEKGFIPSFELIYLISALSLVLAFKRRKRK